MNITQFTSNPAATISRMWCQQVERLLLTELEKIEGRVPSNDEVARHAHCMIHPDGAREYKWRGRTILRMSGWRVEEDGKLAINYALPKP